MAASTDCGQGAARAAAPAIETCEHPACNSYRGTPDQLIAAGLIRPDQVPTRRGAVNYVNGQRHTSRGNFKRNENWFSVCLMPGGRCCVLKGVSGDEHRRRLAAEEVQAAAVRRELAAAEAAEAQSRKALHARAVLASVPRTADAFRRDLAKELRWMVRVVLEKGPEVQRHGFALAPASLEAALLSLDAVVEEIVGADVVIDHAAHTSLIHECHAQIAAGVPALSRKVAQLGVPDPAILGDEVRS